MIIKYYCSKCKAYIHEDLVGITKDNLYAHEIKWKNGMSWFSNIHQIFSVVTKD